MYVHDTGNFTEVFTFFNLLYISVLYIVMHVLLYTITSTTMISISCAQRGKTRKLYTYIGNVSYES